jgi:hypothetical protein
MAANYNQLISDIKDALIVNLTPGEGDAHAENIADAMADAIFKYLGTSEIVLTIPGADVEGSVENDVIAKIKIDGP